MPKPHHPLTALALFALSLTIGCGDSGPVRYDLSGKVTYKGQPVPFGMIRFLPDAKQGNRGPAAFAAIENGQYDTATGGRGTAGGPHQVTISGFDGNARPELEMPHGASLFRDFELTLDLPKETATQDFEIPKSAARRR